MDAIEVRDSFINELSTAALSIQSSGAKRMRVALEDSARTVLELVYSRRSQRIRGRISSARGHTEFELRIRPKQLEYRYPAAGMLGTLSCPRRGANESHMLEDQASIVARLAFRLQHFSILQCVREGIRQSIPAPRPIAH